MCKEEKCSSKFVTGAVLVEPDEVIASLHKYEYGISLYWG